MWNSLLLDEHCKLNLIVEFKSVWSRQFELEWKACVYDNNEKRKKKKEEYLKCSIQVQKQDC